jgi:hypothetical protein
MNFLFRFVIIKNVFFNNKVFNFIKKILKTLIMILILFIIIILFIGCLDILFLESIDNILGNSGIEIPEISSYNEKGKSSSFLNQLIEN